MSRVLVISAVLALGFGSGPVQAVTTFNGSSNNDFLNGANWNNGVPDGGNGAGRINSTAVLSGSTNYNANGSNIIVGYGSSTSFTIESGSTLTMTGGKLDVGRDSNVGTFNVQGGLDTSGDINVINGSMNVDDKLSIKGVLTVNDDGLLSVGNDVDLIAGTASELYFSSGATFAGTPSLLRARNGSTLGFEIDGAGNHAVMAGDSLQVRLGGTSSFQVDFSEVPTVGETFDLITGVEKFANYQGNGTGYEFGTVTVNGLDTGQGFNLIYDTTVADAGFLRLEVVPEPATLSFIALTGVAMIFIRKRFLV